MRHPKPPSMAPHHHHHPSSPLSLTKPPFTLLCRHHSASETLDILILTLALFSSTFLVISYLSYILHSLSLLLPSPTPLSLLLLLLPLSLLTLPFLLRKCRNPKCRKLKKENEFDLQIQTEECLKAAGEAVRAVDALPWKGGDPENPDYESLRKELRKMAPINGRAVLLFTAKCGCPLAKLEGWGATIGGRKHKKGLALSGGHRR